MKINCFVFFSDSVLMDLKISLTNCTEHSCKFTATVISLLLRNEKHRLAG